MRTYSLFVISKFLIFAAMYVYCVYIRKNAFDKSATSLEALEKKPESFTLVQKKTLVLIFVSFAIMVIPNIINTFADISNPLLKNFVKLCKPHAILIIFAAAASFMNIADTKKALNRVPVGTVMIVSRVAFLMEIAKEAGLNDSVMALFQTVNLPAFLLAPLFCIRGAFLSVFSSDTSVVLPLLFPLVPALSEVTGLNVVTLYTAAMIGALGTPISPFSTAGAQFVSLAPDDLADTMVKRQLGLAGVMAAANTLLALAGFCALMPMK